MAIIRKGDKEAEDKLKKRAKTQSRNRLLASDEQKRKAGLEFAGTKDVTKKKDGTTKATKLSTKKSIRITKSESPVSGSAITEAKIIKMRDKNKRDAAYKKFTGRD
jgi:hypothetical protein